MTDIRSRLAQIDNGRRVGRADLHARRPQHCLGRVVRRMNVRRFETRQLRNPTPHVVAGRIELRALRQRIEDAEVRRRIGT